LRGRSLRRQRGVAIITALLLTTLAVTIVASLFWQQQVQVRSIENQRMQLQKQWILRGALDWARLILSTSYQSSPMVDNLQQPWSVGLAETRLDSYVENGRSDSEASDATISGRIIDAQSYLNLAGLSAGGVVKPQEIAAFERLLTLLHLDPGLAKVAATGMAAAQARTVTPAEGGGTAGNAGDGTQTPVPTMGLLQGQATRGVPESVPTTLKSTGPMPITQIDDLLALPGFTPEIVAKLKNFVVILPKETPVNVNTVSAEVLSARIASLSLQGAQALVANRDRAPFKDVADFQSRFAGQTLSPDAATIAVRTDYFIVDGKVKLNRAGLEVLALIERTGSVTGPVASRIVWVREN
jgi:general secretion pathway protein K